MTVGRRDTPQCDGCTTIDVPGKYVGACHYRSGNQGENVVYRIGDGVRVRQIPSDKMTICKSLEDLAHSPVLDKKDEKYGKR